MQLHSAQAAHALLRRQGVEDACGMEAALLQQFAGKSGERKFHNCYLHTDVLADVIKRRSWGLTPSTLRHAAWGRLGRHAAARHGTAAWDAIPLITDKRVLPALRSRQQRKKDCNPKKAGSCTWTLTPCTQKKTPSCLSDSEGKLPSLWTTTSPPELMSTWTGLPPRA